MLMLGLPPTATFSAVRQFMLRSTVDIVAEIIGVGFAFGVGVVVVVADVVFLSLLLLLRTGGGAKRIIGSLFWLCVLECKS